MTAYLKSRKTLRADVLLYAVGRQGNTAGLKLEAAGLEADDRGRLHVDDCFRTPVPHIHAAGDVVGFPSLASVSMEQGRVAWASAFGIQTVIAPGLFPYGLYTIPEISFVGRTEEDLTAAGVPYEAGMAHYREIAPGQIIGDTTGRLKLLFHLLFQLLFQFFLRPLLHLLIQFLLKLPQLFLLQALLRSLFQYPFQLGCRPMEGATFARHSEHVKFYWL